MDEDESSSGFGKELRYAVYTANYTICFGGSCFSWRLLTLDSILIISLTRKSCTNSLNLTSDVRGLRANEIKKSR